MTSDPRAQRLNNIYPGDKFQISLNDNHTLKQIIFNPANDNPLFINYDGKSIEDIFNTIDKESTWDPDWNWHTDLNLILEEVKSRTNFAKDIKKGVLIGFNKSNYDIIGYKSSILDMLAKNINYKNEYVKIFTEETNTKTDGFVLNWEYLEACEINVPEKYRWSKAKYVEAFRK